MLFRGQSYRSLDAKGRLVLPPEFREALAALAQGSFVLTTYDGCLVGYPGPLWSELEERFARLRNSSRKIRDFRRLVLGGAEDQSLDAQGRLRLSRAHMEYAGLEHDAVVVGQGDKFEIWDQARFKALLVPPSPAGDGVLKTIKGTEANIPPLARRGRRKHAENPFRQSSLTIPPCR